LVFVLHVTAAGGKIMFQKYRALIALLPLLFAVVSCGDNKTKEKLVGTSVVSGSSAGAATTSGDSSTAAAQSAAFVLQSANIAPAAGAMGSGIGIPAPVLESISRVPAGGLPADTDGDGWREYTGVTSTIKIQLMDAAGSVLSDSQIFMGTAIRRIRVRISTTYTYGGWSGEFDVVRDAAGAETMSGTITSADPVGGSFTETLAGITMDQTIIAGQQIGIPKSGTSSLVSTGGGYSGTFTYTKDASGVYKHEGDILYQSQIVARVYLTFNASVGNYTGYYLDAAGERHEIQ